MAGGGLLWFAQVSPGGSFMADILGPSIVTGFGLAFAFVAGTIAATSGVSGEQAGLASGLVNTSQQIGGALGLARADRPRYCAHGRCRRRASPWPSPRATRRDSWAARRSRCWARC